MLQAAAGQRIGTIRFGPRVDVYLPEGTRPLAAEGQTAIAGETVIADLATPDPRRTLRVTRAASPRRTPSTLPCREEGTRTKGARGRALARAGVILSS
jgi:hypothetical protein